MLWVKNAVSVLGWYNEYHACKEGLCSPPEYKKRQCRWYDAERTYSGAMADIRALLAVQGKENKTDGGLKALRFNLNKRKAANVG